MGRTRALILVALLCFSTAVAAPQDLPASDPSAALSEALSASCRQNDAQFAHYLTADNAAAFRNLTPGQRVALMKRLVQLDEPGRPLLSGTAGGRIVVRCETPALTTEMRLGETRVRENLAFVPVSAAVVGAPAREVQFGLVREGGGWRLLSVGLLLLDIPTLAEQWAQQTEAPPADAGEAAAIAALRRLGEAVETYFRAFGKAPATLAQLGPAPKEGISPAAAGLVDAELAAGRKGGYVFQYVALTSAKGAGENSQESEPRYTLTAQPVEYGKTGRRSFFLDASGILRGADKQGAAATTSDPRIELR